MLLSWFSVNLIFVYFLLNSHMVWIVLQLSCTYKIWACLMQHTLFGRMLDEMLKPTAINISILDRPHTPTHTNLFILPLAGRTPLTRSKWASLLFCRSIHFSTPVFQNGDYHSNTALVGLRDAKRRILSIVEIIIRGNINEAKQYDWLLSYTGVCSKCSEPY